MPNAMGTLIREHRRAQHLTQRELADAVGIDFTYVSKIENGRLDFPPSNETIQKIADAIGCDRLALMEASGKMVKVAAPELARYRRIEAAARLYVDRMGMDRLNELRRQLDTPPAADPNGTAPAIGALPMTDRRDAEGG